IVRAHPEYVEAAHAAGHEVHVWVANAAADIELCAAVGVDAIITDDPEAALRQLTARSTRLR
ncbi:MAG: glycerophosphodiester phosphodiesterase, partial [Actinomycetota bacterium]|nr:glycerophosphodiester phosphodiesterase [Actinomycetota bacterium]